MGLSGLDSALSGLRIYQQQIDIISNNVANASTEGFTRKILPQSTQVVAGKSVGVLGETIIRNVDLRVQRDLWTQISDVGLYGVQASYLQRIEQFHGSPDKAVSVAAEISRLRDSFAALANSPDDQFLQTEVVNQAVDTADKIRELSDFILTLRNDAQSEMDSVVTSINDLLVQIAELNSEIGFSQAAGQTTAAAEDLRDQSIKELSEFISLSTFRRGDGVMIIQTLEGVELASNQPSLLTFRPTPVSATTYYPDTAAGIFVGDPTKTPSAIDITERNLGGKLGGLVNLRDDIFPKQTAQIDELAHKMALRFDAQGLRLFTDPTGAIPPDTPPDTSTIPVTPVQYVGFASAIQVNQFVVNDPNLLQQGTYGGSLPSGAGDVVSRVIEHVFGDINFQLIENTDTATSVDIRAAATGGTTLQEWLGLRSSNTVLSTTSLASFATMADVLAAGGPDVFGSGAAETDQFIIRFDDPDIGGGPYDVEVDLDSIPASGATAAHNLMNYITADADWFNIVTDFGGSVSVGANGELVIDSRSNIEIVQSPVEPISDTGMAFIGLGFGLSEAQDPYFDVQVGNANAIRIALEPTDTEVELLAKLNAIDGLAAQIDADGFLSLRPGNDFVNPDFGGTINIIGGPFSVNAATLGGTALGRTTLDDDANIIGALFGTYQDLGGGVIEGYSPITDRLYQSETEAGSGVFQSFRSSLLGQGTLDITKISQGLTIEDYARKIINENAQELALLESRREDAETLEILLTQSFLDQSSVNLDEELGFLIVVQTAYAASARVISAVDQIFQELLDVV
ncbi:MAG: flagellar hook-associated protein FlgK [Alphaproteobacteria bacterium]|nr:flagellar hook-associated protein FlgK [Alphaproteobacteria bacterium]